MENNKTYELGVTILDMEFDAAIEKVKNRKVG